ncbi:glycosyl hydrolase family 38 protein [Artemisia annua]|uniref:Glycosyl hydrolase family 38 protein n=1 Tax=Artemisia annua TaxID=35608 RepID=A0A2U1P658_ARTAN|nr:glycosyl hydrolase family 38 protein [Artemisia annua]
MIMQEQKCPLCKRYFVLCVTVIVCLINFQCPLLNISYCPSTEADLSSGKKLVVVVYSSLGWKRSDVIRHPAVSKNIAVFDSSGKQVESQLLPVVKDSIALINYYATTYTTDTPLGAQKSQLLTFEAFKPNPGPSLPNDSNAASVTSSQQPISRSSKLAHFESMEFNEASETFKHQSILKILRQKQRSQINAPFVPSLKIYSLAAEKKIGLGKTMEVDKPGEASHREEKRK